MRLEGRAAEEVPLEHHRYLTRDPDKLALFTHEPGFRASLASWHGQANSEPPFYHDLSFLLVKPDAVVSGAASRILDLLGDHGFEIVASSVVQLSSASVHALWRYSWNTASAVRSVLSTAIATAGPSLLIWVRSREGAYPPTSVRLSRCKGNAQAFLREKDSIRSSLGAANPMLSLIHAPDEPADVVRESQIILGDDDLRALVHRLRSMSAQEARLQYEGARRKIDVITSLSPQQSILYDDVLSKLLRAAQSPTADAEVRALAEYVTHCAEHLSMDWWVLREKIAKSNDRVGYWDALVLASYSVFQNYENDKALLKNLSSADWGENDDE